MKPYKLILLALIFVISGCSATPPNTKDNNYTFTDSLGNTVQIEGYERVIAASGSFAQIWLLAGGSLAGTTDDAFSSEIVQSVQIPSVGSLHTPNLETIISLNPQLVLLSADISGHLALSEQLAAAGIPAAYFSVETFDDYLNMLSICTGITGRGDLYEGNGLSIQSGINELIEKARFMPAPKILLLRAGAGKVSARNSDTMAGAMLKDLNCINIADSENGLLQELSMETIISDEPDFIFLITMGESEEAANKAVQDTLLSNPAWNSLSAVKNNRFITLPKELFHQKPNNRWGEAYQILWEALYEQKTP